MLFVSSTWHLLVCAIQYKKSLKYQSGNQNSYIEEEQTTQWPTEKVQNNKQRSTKQTHKTKDRITRTPLKPGGELRCSGRVGSSCSASGTRRVNLVTNPVASHLCSYKEVLSKLNYFFKFIYAKIRFHNLKKIN
jgi:hypothetical protein